MVSQVACEGNNKGGSVLGNTELVTEVLRESPKSKCLKIPNPMSPHKRTPGSTPAKYHILWKR